MKPWSLPLVTNRVLGLVVVLVIALQTIAVVQSSHRGSLIREVVEQNQELIIQGNESRLRIDRLLGEFGDELRKQLREHDTRTSEELERLLVNARIIIEQGEGRERIIVEFPEPDEAPGKSGGKGKGAEGG